MNSTPEELAVAKAIWDNSPSQREDDVPKWDDLHPVMDSDLRIEIVSMARAAIAAIDAVRQR